MCLQVQLRDLFITIYNTVLIVVYGDNLMLKPEHQVGIIGTTVIITCDTETKPIWTKDKKILKKASYTLTTDNIITITKLQKKHEGIYSCRGQYKDHDDWVEKSELLVAGKY